MLWLAYFYLILRPEKYIKLEVAVTLFLIVALALGSLAPAWYTGSLHNKLKIRMPWALLFTSAAIHTLFFALGYLPAEALNRFMPGYACFAGQFIVFIVGLKLIVEAIRFYPEEKIVLIDDRQSLLLVGVARGFNYFLIGLGLGFCAGFNLYFLYILFAFEAAAIAFGLLLGQRYGLRAIIRTLFLISGIGILTAAVRSIILLF